MDKQTTPAQIFEEYRQGVRQERVQEIRLLWHIVEFIMLVTFIVLAIDQVGLYGFLFVWFFIALAAASIVLLLAGLIRAFRKKRAGIMILVSLIGIIGCIAWFIFLVSSKSFTSSICSISNPGKYCHCSSIFIELLLLRNSLNISSGGSQL